jgi:hypothetical protein
MGTAYAGESPGQDCLSCHSGDLSLQTVPAEELQEKIRKIIDKSEKHVTPIEKLTEEQLRALVEALTRPTTEKSG